MMTGLENSSRQVEVTGLRITLEARDPAWELPPLKSGAESVALIGWLTNIEPVDQGVPPLARAIISRSLTRHCRVTFPYPEEQPSRSSADWVQTAVGSIRLLESQHRHGLRRNRPIPLLSTIQAEVAARLFRAFPFTWEMKTQVAILTDPHASPPDLSYETVQALLDRKPIDGESLGVEAQVRGLLIPAVDGDFAALVVFDPELLHHILDTLADECNRAGVSWDTLTESAFRGGRSN